MKASKTVKLLLVTMVLFAVLFPLVNSINFYQNDDWVYYEMVGRFMRGDFTLHWYSGPTFYLQGLIGAVFSKIFSIEKLPVLTLAFSTANFFLLAFIITRFFYKNLYDSIVLSLLYFFSPINLYLILGFMTAQYFMFFLLLSLATFLYYEKTEKLSYLVGTLILSFLGLLIRQVALSIPLSIGLYLLYKRKFREGLACLGFFVGIYGFYSYMLPLTPRIKEVPLQLHHLIDFGYSYSLIYGTLLVLTALLIPTVISAIDDKELLNSTQKMVFVLSISAILFIVLNHFFKPMKISWGEFPYFENTWERMGFYPRGVGGTKYHFIGSFDLYRYWDLAAKILFSLAVSYFTVFKKNIINFYSVFIAIYTSMLVVTETMYDRYIVILIPFSILFLLKLNPRFDIVRRIITTVFVVFLAFYGYEFSMDFVKVNKYIWNRAEEISQNIAIPREQIQATNAWKLNYRNFDRDYLYNFSYDSPEVNEGYAKYYVLLEIKTLEFPLSIFIEPKIYLYRLL